MPSRVASKMEPMGLGTADTLQQCTSWDLCSFFLFVFTLSAAFYAVAILSLIGIAMLIIIVQPYKAKFSSYNAVDSVFILTLAMWCGTAAFFNIAASKAHRLLKTSLLVWFLVAVLPLLYLVVIFLHWICSRNRFGQRLVCIIKSQIGRVHKHMTQDWMNLY